MNQAGVSAADYRGDNAPPHLKDWVSGQEKTIRSSTSVAQVVRDANALPIASTIHETLVQECGAELNVVDPATGVFDLSKKEKAQIIKVDFSAPSADKLRRKGELRENGRSWEEYPTLWKTSG